MEGTSTNATVKVYETGSTEETATRKNDYYFRDWDPDTTSTASNYPEINIKEGTTVSATKNAWIPGVSETPITYDANGNLTADALWSYTYDEQNRLITMEETSAAATAGFPDTTITFKYDYLGRRVEKKVVRGTTTESHLRFVWRGWLLVAELNATSDNARVKTYTWGPDISGSFGGVGGNGGVLIFQDHTSTVNESFYPAYDAQGNVTGLIDAAGNLDAAYEYDPFGKLIRYAGTRSASMSLLYGTKYTDMESGLIYYGHRYYDPRQGCFINRDPIEEEGGINLYGFVGNNPLNAIDFLGLCDSEGDIFPMGTDGDENCIEDYDLQPFTVDEQITNADLQIWAFQDELTERVIEQLNSLALNRPNNVDNGNSSPGNGEGNKKDDNTKIEKEEEDNEKTDCEKLVDELVDLAESDVPWWRYTNARVSTGLGMMSASWYDHQFWDGTPHHPLLGPDRLGGGNGTRINYPVTGFRPELVDHGQNSDVMKHILGHAGAHVAGTGLSLSVAYIQNYADERDAANGRLQSTVEVLNNEVGRLVGRSMVETMNGNQSEAVLRIKLLQMLCANDE